MPLKYKVAALAAALALAAPGGARAARSILPMTPPAASGHATNPGFAAPDDCDPYSDWSDANDDLLPGQSRPVGTRLAWRASRDGSAAQVIGTTPEEIHRRFVRVITANLTNAGTASRVARLSDKELAAIGAHAALASSADRAALLKVFATRLDAKALVRVARAFGRDQVAAAVHAYADRETRAGFDRDVAGMRAGSTRGGGGSTTPYPSPSPPRPTVDMTLEEIYLEYRTAPVGSLSRAGALAETTNFAGLRLSAWYTGGVMIGSAISWLISTYDPALDDAIGGTIAGMIDNFWAATGETEQGHFEAAFDELFGFPVTNSSDPSSDWDTCSSMVYYYQFSGTCGF